MMRGMIRGIAAALCGSALAGCGDFRSAGATSETTNGDLQARALNADGSAAAGVRVLLVEEGDWLGRASEGKSVILDSARADAQGRFALRLPAGRTCNLQIEGEKEGAFLAGAQSMGGRAERSIHLAAYAKVSGKSVPVRELRLAGTAWTAIPGGDGAYAFPAIAPGAYSLMAFGRKDGAVHAWQARDLDAGPSADLRDQDVGEAQAVLLDDFTVGWKQSALGRVLGEGLWYLATDSADGGNSAVQAATVAGAEAWSGPSLRAAYRLGTRLNHPWAILGCNLGTALRGKTYDFSGLTSVTLMAKGSGTVNLRFLSLAVSRQYADSIHYYFPLKLPAAWTRVVIPVDSLRMAPEAPAAARAITWPMAAKEMQTLDFTVEKPEMAPGDSVLFWADDIRLEGLSLDSLAR